jgi:hypothetical protein
MAGFKEHPETSKVAEDVSGNPTLLNVDSSGNLLVDVVNPTSLPTTSTGAVEVTSSTILAAIQELLREVKRSNMYLALLTGEEVSYSDIEE